MKTYKVNPLMQAEGDGFYYAAKTNKQLIADCYASGGSPVVSGGGQFIQCDGAKISRKVSPGFMGADGFYNASGVGCAVQFPFNKTKRTQCEQLSQQTKSAKASETQSNAELNSALAQAIINKSNQPEETGPSAGKVILISSISIGVLAIGFFLIRKFRKK